MTEREKVWVVIVSGWTRPPERSDVDKVTAHDSREAADRWAEDQRAIARHGYSLHECEVRG